MEQKTLILGAKGMLGQALARVFASQNPILWDFGDLDITNEKKVREKLLALKPTLILNATGFTDVDGAETNKELAVKVNGKAVGYLAKIAKELGAILVHYSTDYVFAGEKKEGYKEDDQPNPISAYGYSKFLGEKELAENGEMYYLIRSSWMFGQAGQKNFVQKILAKAEYEKEIRVVNDQFGRPTYANDLAKKTKEIIDSFKPCGIYHLTNQTPAGGITWYDLAKKAVELKGLKTKVVPCQAKDFPKPAKRPKHGVLLNTKLEPLRDWQEALQEYLQ